MPREIFYTLNIRPHIHLSSYIRLFLNYYTSQVLWGSPETVVCGNYSKVLQYVLDYKTRNLDSPVYPIVSGTFQLTTLDEKTDFNWRHGTRGTTYFSSLMHDPIFEDPHVQITPVYSRHMGTSEVIVMAHSSPELQDFHMVTMQWFDLNRWFLLPEFETNLLIPVELIMYQYKNDPGSYQYIIDWAGTELDQQLIRSMDQTHYVFPLKSKPMIRIASISEGTTYYGGGELDDHRLNITFEWDIELPAFITLNTDYKIDDIKTVIMINGEIDSDFDYPDTGGTISLGDSLIENMQVTHSYLTFHNIVIPEDLDKDQTIDLALPLPVTPNRKIVIVSYWGPMQEDDEWSFVDDSTIRLGNGHIKFNKDDYIQVFYYEHV